MVHSERVPRNNTTQMLQPKRKVQLRIKQEQISIVGGYRSLHPHRSRPHVDALPRPYGPSVATTPNLLGSTRVHEYTGGISIDGLFLFWFWGFSGGRFLKKYVVAFLVVVGRDVTADCIRAG